MKHKNKGSETKDSIIKVCRSLFYDHGYKSTTSRMIAGQAEVNLGLLDYYFNGKEEIAALIYFDVRDSFDELYLANEPQTTPLDLFFISSALELYLCLECPPYGRFFDEVILFPAIHQRLLQFNTTQIAKYNLASKDPDYPMLASLSIASIKPALVDHALHSGTPLTTTQYLTYYLDQQLHYFGLNQRITTKYLTLLTHYYLTTAPNFTPVLTRLV